MTVFIRRFFFTSETEECLSLRNLEGGESWRFFKNLFRDDSDPAIEMAKAGMEGPGEAGSGGGEGDFGSEGGAPGF